MKFIHTVRVTKKCQICNNNSVGFHYGAYVCEACKKFFVRHASGVCRLNGSCRKKGKCNLNIDGRGKCQQCRFKRCEEVGMNLNSKGSDYDLTSIPCQVCDGKSSGLHFGCITCEGCKGFFRRMIECKGNLVCVNNNKCKLSFKNRNSCKSCRMNRCLNVGMSRKGIRIGRHTNSLKYNCLNILKKDSRKSESKSDNDSEFNESISVNSNDNIEESLFSVDATQNSKTELTDEAIKGRVSPIEIITLIESDNDIEAIEAIATLEVIQTIEPHERNETVNTVEMSVVERPSEEYTNSMTIEEKNENIDNEISDSLSSSVTSVNKENVSESNVLKFFSPDATLNKNEINPDTSECLSQNLTVDVMDVKESSESESLSSQVQKTELCVSECFHLKNTLDCNEEEAKIAKTNLSEIERVFSEASSFLTKENWVFALSGKMKTLLTEYDSSQNVWSYMMDHFVFHSQFIVKYVKLMPGFSYLSLEDKKSIIKDSMYPMILLELSEDYYEVDEESYFNYFDFSSTDRQIILKFFPEFLEFSNHVQKSGFLSVHLQLDKYELTLLCGIMMFFNYHNLNNWMYGKSMVLLYQEYLLLYFRSQLRLTESELTIRHKMCLDFIAILNEMNIQHHNIVINFCANHTELQYPDLYIEVFKH